MSKNEYPLVHIYPQSGPRQVVRIVGNTEGLLTLVTALIEATSTVGFAAHQLCVGMEKCLKSKHTETTLIQPGQIWNYPTQER